ncbi:MAG: N-6 DNA methylase [Oscillospiraceae bacterium]|jgi:hypothetical protein|nr:N-6 DNA methylase [Oscillospiraceae bacterium]
MQTISLDKYRSLAKKFNTEEDVRAETNHFLRESCDTFGIHLTDSGHEVTSVFGGRADSIYSDVIIEYKSPAVDLRSEKGFNEVILGRDHKDRGLMHYLINFSLEESHSDSALFIDTLTSKVGVGFNGATFVFARFIHSTQVTNLFDKAKTKSFPVGINANQPVTLVTEVVTDLEIGMKKFFLYLRSTGRKRLSSASILELFGPDSEECKDALSSIHNCLCENIENNNVRVITLYNEWKRIFGDVYGEIETDFTSIRQSLVSLYPFAETEPDIRRVVFSVQTYYNIILKIIIHDLLNSLNDPAYKRATVSKQSDVLQLFSGKSTGKYNIQNFFEIQFFEWFLYARNFDISVINTALINIDLIEATASVIKPEIVEDVFREVYNGLMPRDVRHLLGEYYTPGWLVEFVLDKASYTGQKDLTLLDPACGSGSFVTHAIKRFVGANGNMLTVNEIVKKVTSQIVGYDINPITVITAKTNYILALGDISLMDEAVTIPIYMCDSILVPTVHAKQNEESHSIKVSTIVGEFEIPVFRNRVESDAFMKEVSSHVEHYTFDEFVEYLTHNHILSLDGANIAVAKSFYEKICVLHLASEDSFWGTILKNSFAPLFSRSGFDVVVGNPPWIAWKAMSDTYRKQTLDIWLSYGIFEKSAYDKITTHDDFAMAVTYVSIDHYCKTDGELVFVLPQTFLKASKGGEGFRKFRITRDGLIIPFAVTEVYDMLGIQPFRGVANNRASVIKFKKNTEMTYPMDDYYECLPNGNGTIRYTVSYRTAIEKFSMNRLSAKPVNANDERSPWLTMPKADLLKKNKFLGQSAYRGRKGIEPCGAKGVYLLDVVASGKNEVTIENLIERSRLPEAKALGVHRGKVEREFVYPMIGGRNIDKWGINSYLYMLVPHYSDGDGIYRGVPESELKIRHPKTWEWLMYFHDLLLETRIRSGKFFDEKLYPFYRLDNVGPYTFQPYHVVWREQNRAMVACVVSSIDTAGLGAKTVVTDSKVLFCSFDNEQEAHFLCAVINSPVITKLIESYTIDTQRGVDILSNIKIPKFSNSNKVHIQLAQASIKSHRAYNEKKNIEKIEKAIDTLVESLFD